MSRKITSLPESSRELKKSQYIYSFIIEVLSRSPLLRIPLYTASRDSSRQSSSYSLSPMV